MPTREQLDQAIEIIRNSTFEVHTDEDILALRIVFKAAKRFGHLLPTQCPDCEGSGIYMNYAPPGMGEPMPCESCGGKGTVIEIPDEWITAAVRASGAVFYEATEGANTFPTDPLGLPEKAMRAALRAVLGEVTE